METAEPAEGGSRRERERHKCREQILAAAAEMFARHGYDKTSMKDIADRADMSVGKLYTCFEGKKEICRQLLKTYMVELHRRADEACRETDPPLEQMRCRLKAVVGHFKENIDFLMIYHNESPIAFEGFIRHEIEYNRELAANLIERAMDAGSLRREDAAALGAIVVGAVHELMHMFLDAEKLDRLDEVPEIVERLIVGPLVVRKA